MLAAVGIFTLLVGGAVRLRRSRDPATLHFFWLCVAFFGLFTFSFSGRQLVVPFDWPDFRLSRWETATGRPLPELASRGLVTSLAAGADGRLLVAGNYNSVSFWDVETGEELQRLEGHFGNLQAVAILPDGKTAVTTSALDRRPSAREGPGRRSEAVGHPGLNGEDPGVHHPSPPPGHRRVAPSLWQVDVAARFKAPTRRSASIRSSTPCAAWTTTAGRAACGRARTPRPAARATRVMGTCV